MTYTVYQPVPVLLPEDSNLRREFLTRRTDWGGRTLPPLRDEEYAQYDTRTMFYDVFRRAENPRKIIAIGPPPVNLESELRGLKISCGGRTFRHRLRWYHRFTIMEMTLDRGAASRREIELDFKFPSFTARVQVSSSEKNSPHQNVAKPIAMMTLQKDNEIAWIEDWCRWHHRLHGVARFYIYDNGSANIEALEKALRGLSDEMEILLVRWPYPHGPHGQQILQKFSQVGALNHYRLRFGRRDRWCLLMDVDEYLVAPGKRSLREIVSANERRGTVSLPIASFVVPPHPGQGPIPERRIWHYAWRNRNRLFQRFNMKCVCIPSRVVCIHIHYTLPGNRLLEYCARWRFGYRLLRDWYRELPDWIAGMERDIRLWRRSGAWLLRRVFPGTRRVRVHPLDGLFFFHFFGLNTNWKQEGKGEQVESFDPKHHVKDPRIRALAEQAGIVPEEADNR